jgi:general secretion pathway protein D
MKALLGALLAMLLASLARAQDQRPAPIQEQGDNYILNFSEDATEQLPLLDFVKLCQEATGFNFTYDPGTGQLLQGAKVVMLGTKTIPKSEFYNFFQIQLFINDFVCLEVGPPQIRVILIQSLASAGQARGGGSALGKNPTFVAPQDLSDYVDQPAQLIITVLNFKNIDTRQLQTQLRQLLVDQTGSQQVVPAGERSLIMQGFGSYVASLANLLLLVDETSATTASVQPVFDLIPLEFAAAEDVADLLEQLLEAQQESISRRPRQQAIEGQGVSSLLPGAELESKILVDARTNSLLVMALPEEMPRIKDLVARLDVDVIEPERNFHVYKLQNVKAGELAEVLDEFLSGAERLSGTPAGGTGGRPDGGGGNQGGGGASARTSNEVVVVPDEMANALLIAANKTRYEEVLELVRQLDVRQDQVLIESALIELTGADFRDIGVEWAFADSTGDGGFGVTGFGLSSLEDTDGDVAPDTRIPLSPTQGLVAGILSGDDVNLPLLLSAAQRTTGANVLNVPSVLVNNNGSARVVTLDQQPTTQVTASGAGNQTQENFAGYQDAGITLEISPSISASRYLRLDISLIVSNFTGSFSSNSTIPPPRVTREMKTTVNVPDGDTMVIGGVISDSAQKTRIGMPWLADLPLVGALFRRDSDTNSRTTLYFFVTPHILRDPDFADLSEISYRKKLSAAEIMGKDRVRMVDPDFGASDSVIDFGSFQVPLYRAAESGEIEAGELGIDPLRGQELLRESREDDETPPNPEPEPEPDAPEGDGSR